MGDLVVIVPSRGRPQNIARLRQAWLDTARAAALMVCVDDDDPTLPAYFELADASAYNIAPREGLAGTLNRYARRQAERGLFSHIGFMGDDHLPRTVGWDKLICEALDELGTGIVYGNDLFQGQNLPTAVFLTADIVRALGYMCPPGLKHMYLDNAWLAWGRGIDRIRYLPQVVIEHIHPHAGKGEPDGTYGEVWPLMGPDGEAFRTYMTAGYRADIDKLQALL